MSDPVFNPTGLIDRAALEFLRSKKLLPGYSHYDVWLYQHAVAFTVAKMMDADMLAEVKDAVETAQRNGTSFEVFKQRLKPYLMSRGWWGEQVMTDPVDGVSKLVQLGSTRRLRVIFQTNMATAFAAGQWARIQSNQKALPYLRYNKSAAGQPRDSHRRYYGLVLPVEHPIWKQIFPPNGYGCQCSVSQLSRKQAEREGISGEPDVDMVEFTNPRTGQTVLIPADITPSFAHNHGDRLGALQALMADKHGKAALDKLLLERGEYLSQRGQADIFASSQSIIDEGRRLFEMHKSTIGEALLAGRPHEGILAAMRAEGVEFGGVVEAYSSNEETATEFAEVVKVYPKAWIDESNKLGRVLVEDAYKKRAWHFTPDNEEQLKYVASMLRRKVYPENKGWERFHWAFKGRKRVFQLGDGMIINDLSSSKRNLISTQIHEFAHRLQSAMPELDNHFTRLWKERTANDTVKTMREMTGFLGYDVGEIGKRDDFPNPYYGKMYGTEKDPQPKEMMTMIFEGLLGGDPARFKELAAKPDFLHFGLALLMRYKP